MGRKRPLAEVEVKVLDRDCLKRALELVQDPTRGGEVDDCYPHLRGKLTRVRRLKTRHFCQHDVMRTNDGCIEDRTKGFGLEGLDSVNIRLSGRAPQLYTVDVFKSRVRIPCHSLISVQAKVADTASGRDWNAIKNDGWASSVSEGKFGPTSVQSLLSQLRRSVSEHDWSSVARIIDFMLNLNGKLMPVIWKACFLVLFNHPNSSAQTLNDFLMVCLGLTTEQAMSDFLTCLLTLPTDLDNVVKFRQEETYFDSDIISLL
ncbi:hypothetical protein AAG570_007066 [Ranatra chinensis]|uniref:Uncharacterized protein n=1 Tax=Ranatra chinensis TaxID=642074 RepID=A0ABD0XWQ0_9HEMI